MSYTCPDKSADITVYWYIFWYWLKGGPTTMPKEAGQCALSPGCPYVIGVLGMAAIRKAVFVHMCYEINICSVQSGLPAALLEAS